jgi:hypothetical protein
MELEKSIEDWCIYFGFNQYIINEDNFGFVDVHGGVNISHGHLESIPIQFGIVWGSFYCNSNYLTTLKGSPRNVGSNFFCCNNKLTSLEGGPIEVSGNYNCMTNDLITFSGAPKTYREFICYSNPIYEEYLKYDDLKRYLRSQKLKGLL